MITISKDRPVAYFSAEYGLESNIPIYAGGLGVLSGDTLKQAADENFPMVAVGLMYRGGNARQSVTDDGWQTEGQVEMDPLAMGFEHVYVPKEDHPLFVRIHLTTQDVWARVWKKMVGSVALYLLDTDTDQNPPEDRKICNALYYGREEDVVRQQMIMGIGGIKLLDALEIHPILYHVNEGRPAFLYWQLIRMMMDRTGMEYVDAAAKAKDMIVYTNHTLVRAGNKSYDMDMLKRHSIYYADKMGISVDELLAPGWDNETGGFNMTHFALATSKLATAVSRLHFECSKDNWPEYNWTYVTNGVHFPTWQDEEIRDVDLSNDSLWAIHLKKKQALANFVKMKTGFSYDPNRLVITWARRIASYKRMDALFYDIERLKQIVNQSGKEVQILLAGKAHAADTGAKEVLKRVIGYMQSELAGHALYIPNYSIEIAQMLTRGSDVWVNTPVKGMEASGTSGMKAAANGVLQLTVEDGWTCEVDWHGIGWTLDPDRVAETLYFRLTEDVIPEYYKRNEAGISVGWLERMKRTINMSNGFSAARMLKEYRMKVYDCVVEG
jgi:glucan phosphorylase